ncbi:HipA family kinase [Nesterenkonia populi]
MVRELVASDQGSTDLQQGLAAVFVKNAAAAGHPVHLHEYLASRLAHSMGLPVPFGELADIEGNRAWASAVVGSGGNAPPPADVAAAAAAEPHLFAGICVFDVWVHNIDRTEENLIYGPEVGLWAIDHEQAFGGFNPLSPNDSLNSHVAAIARPFQWEGVTPEPERMKPWLQLIQVNGRRWAEVAAHAAWRRKLQSKSVLTDYERFLRDRAQGIAPLVHQAFGFSMNSLF